MTRKMNKKEKDEFRRLLAAKKESIIRKLTDTITESKEMESNVAQDLVDKAETSYTKEFLLSLSDGEREQLLLIDEALKRLEHDEFGVCQLCQKEIGAKEARSRPLDALLHQLPGEGRGGDQGPVSLSFRAGAAGLARLVELLVFPSFCRLCSGPARKGGGKGRLRRLPGPSRPAPRSVCSLLRTVLRGRGGGASLRPLPRESPGLLAPPVVRRLRRRAQGPHPALQVPEVCPAQPSAGPLRRCVPGRGRTAVGAGRFSRPRSASPAATEGTGIQSGQAAGRDLAGFRDLDVLDRCLVKVRNVPPQARLRAADREKNVVRALCREAAGRGRGEDAHPRRRRHHDRGDHQGMRPRSHRGGG